MRPSRLGALRAAILAGAALAAATAMPARAQIGSERYAAIVLDARSGTALLAANADEQRHPASLTKMMTLYMVFEALRDGRLSLESRVVMSEEAASRPPSKLGIPAGNSISVEQAILALVTRSANDVAAAVGERLAGGSEARFAQMMTLRARSLGMSRTTFRNASGLPDWEQVTTARDMATLGRRLFSDFPERYHYFGVTHAQFGGMRIRNHNRMLETYDGVDGIKTGFINASGFNIVTSASRGGQRVVGAVFGGSSWFERDQHMASLLDQGFERLGVRDARPGPVLVRTAQAAPLMVSAARANSAEPRARAAAPAGRTAARAPATRQAASRAAAPASRASTRQAAVQPVRLTARPAATPAAQTARPASRPAATAARSTTTRAAQPATTQRAPAAAPTLQAPRNLGTIRTAELR